MKSLLLTSAFEMKLSDLWVYTEGIEAEGPTIVDSGLSILIGDLKIWQFLNGGTLYRPNKMDNPHY